MQADGVLRPPWEAWPRRWLARSLTEGEQDPAELCRHEFAWAHACAHRPWGPWPGRLARDAAWPAGCLLSRAFGPNVGGLRHLRPLTPGRSRPGPDRRPENADGHAFCPWLCVALSSDSAPLAFSSRPAPLLPSTASPSAINGKSVNCERPLQGHAPISSGPRAAVGNRAQPLSVCLSGLVPLHTLSGGGGGGQGGLSGCANSLSHRCCQGAGGCSRDVAGRVRCSWQRLCSEEQLTEQFAVSTLAAPWCVCLEMGLGILCPGAGCFAL